MNPSPSLKNKKGKIIMSPAIDLRKTIQVIQDILVPGIQEVKLTITNLDTKFTSFREEFKSEIKRLDDKIDNQGAKLDDKIESLGAKLDDKIESLGAKMDSFREEFKSEIKRLDEKIVNQGVQLTDKIDNQGIKMDSFREEFRSHIQRLDQHMSSIERQIQTNREDYKLAVDLHERIAALETKLSSH